MFHKTVEQMYDDLEGVRTIHDDILVWGNTVEEHDVRLKRALERSREKGLKLNYDKCEFRVQQMTFMGDKYTQGGIQPDPK